MIRKTRAATIVLILSVCCLCQEPRAQDEPACLPDAQLTPGRAGNMTAADICKPDYDNPAENIPVELKERVFARYRIGRLEVGYNVDHLIPPKLGGTNSINNLWPQPLSGVWCWHRKNRLEHRLRKLVCSGQLTLEQAQREIATDWVSAYKKYVGMPKALQPTQP